MTLDDEDIEAIAARVAAKVAASPSRGWVGAEGVAARLGVEPNWVYRRWRALGGVKLGTAKNSPVRFDLQAAVERAARLGEEEAPAPKSPTRRRGRPRRDALEPGAELIRGRSGR